MELLVATTIGCGHVASVPCQPQGHYMLCCAMHHATSIALALLPIHQNSPRHVQAAPNNAPHCPNTIAQCRCMLRYAFCSSTHACAGPPPASRSTQHRPTLAICSPAHCHVIVHRVRPPAARPARHRPTPAVCTRTDVLQLTRACTRAQALHLRDPPPLERNGQDRWLHQKPGWY